MLHDPFFPQHTELQISDNPIGTFFLPSDAPNDEILNAIKNGNVYQEDIISEFVFYVKPESTAIDLGSNIGQMTIALSKLVGKNGKVISVEPDPFLFYILNKNIIKNKCFNCNAYSMCAWDSSEINLPYPDPNLSRFESLGSYGVSFNKQTNRMLPAVALDDLNLKNVSFIKIDIQGSELHALRGLKQTILKFKPTILVEYEPIFNSDFKISWDDYENFINEINYKIVKWIDNWNFIMESN
jgi:FkbM family methyltransferase